MRELNVGDWLIYEVRYRSIFYRNSFTNSFQDIGAYTCAASTSFNGFPRPTPIHVIGESTL